MRKTLLFVLLLSGLCAAAQVRRLGVLGSSTANGQGVPADSSWAQKLKKYYRGLAVIDTLHKVAASTYDCYSGMPTGYIPPPDRNAPNTNYNITKLVTRTPFPTTIIISYPTTHYDTFSDEEILFCLDSIKKHANALGAVCFVATTQPRDRFTDAGRARLKYLNDLLLSYFGDFAIDFFTPLNNPATNKIKPEYYLDGVHPNSKGHEVLFQQVLKKNIFNLNLNSIERVLIDAGPAGAATASPDPSGKYWNNMTDARAGLRVSNAVTTSNTATTIRLDVINPIGTSSATDPGTGTSGTVGAIAEYPASATGDNAFAMPAITNGKWKISGLDPSKTYTIRFWGSQMAAGYRIIQIKRSDETAWQEYNAASNKNYNTAATFAFSGKTEMFFDLRVKSGSVAGHVSVIDIVATLPAAASTNQPPFASAGNDLAITLPADSIQLNGSASFDPDGSISGYAWRKISGPSSFAFSNNTIVNPVLRNLAAGTYGIELAVTDNGALTDLDTVQITVNPPQANQPPLANAGMDAATTLPADSVRLSGSGSDPDGSIVSYLWSKVSGPSSYSISNASIASPLVDDLLEGIYAFELRVTDNGGLTAKDTVNITVSPRPATTSQRVLIDAGLSNNRTVSPDQWGKYWNNMTDARRGVRINNVVTVTNSPTAIKLEVINPAGSSGSTDLNVRTSGTIGIVGEYPAASTNDNAFANKSITNGRWKISGLDANATYNVKFWGSYSLAESRIIQIKRSDETLWQEYNAALNSNPNTAASFSFTGKTELSFDIRVKPGNSFGHINVIDISISAPSGMRTNSLMRSHSSTTAETPLQHAGNMIIFPNPAKEDMTIQLDNSYLGPVQISVNNLFGQTLQQEEVFKGTAMFSPVVNLKRLMPGFYILQIRMGTQLESRQVLKIR